MQDKKAILVAVMGTTPAILTETIWALAHKEQTLPDEVVVIATKTGRRKLEEELLSGGNPVWLRLRKALEDEGLPVAGKLRFGETSIRVIPDARGDGIADLRTKEENLGAADFMLRQLRQYTEDPGTVVLTSIAGGRKTMSALMFSCMTLLGRPDDKVYHVLLPSPFEGGVSPAFYFPEKGAVYTAKDGKKYSAADVDGELFEVPYVRMRELYREKYRANPPGYQALVAQVQASVWPAIAVDAWEGRLLVDDRHVPLAPTEFAVLTLLLNACTGDALRDRLLVLHKCKLGSAVKCAWLADFQEGSRFAQGDAKEDLSKTASKLRKKLKAAGFPEVDGLVPMRDGTVTFPVERVGWRNRDKFPEEVRGYLFPGGRA